MSLVVNNNMMAANTARNLNAHYGRLATSTQRLSSGLRVNSAADDAAGLAIRELQRADIAALHQGARNANDAISMIQVADGSLGIIDEKLIRMKELAEQAATGTYDSTQRLMIESEYQAMASEITRIANATDFNGTRLLDGTLSGDHDGSKLVSEGKIKIHFGTGNDSAEDYYYIEIGECTSQAFGLGNASTWADVQNRGVDAFKDSLLKQIKNDTTITDEQRAELLAGVDKAAEQLNNAVTNATNYKTVYKLWANDGTTGFLEEGKEFPGNSSLMSDYLAAATKMQNQAGIGTTSGVPATALSDLTTAISNAFNDAMLTSDELSTKVGKPLANITADEAQPYLDKAIDAALEAARANGLNQKEIDLLKKQIATDITIPKTITTTVWDNTTGGTALKAKLKTSVNTVLALAGNTNASGFGNPAGTTAPTIATEVALRNQGKVEYFDNPDATGIGTTSGVPATAFSDLQVAITDAFNEAMLTSDELAAEIGKPLAKITADEAQPYLDKAIDAALEAARANGLNQKEIDLLKSRIAPTATAALKAASPLTTNMWDSPTHATSIRKAVSDHVKVVLGLAGSTNTDGFGNIPTGGEPTIATEVALRNQGKLEAKQAFDDNLGKFWNELRTTEKEKLQYSWGQAALYNLAKADPNMEPAGYGIGAEDFGFANLLGKDKNGKDITTDNEMLAQALKDMQAKVGHMDFAGHTIETQEDAQNALDAINEAIVSKDKIRAHLGAAQNRLENTVSNLNIQAENLQAAESRISDVDVATEMTQFVRNQILTQSAVAMLSQANSLPQMAMQLIGG